MQRYFCETLNNNTFTLSNDDSYHINKVMRMNKDDLIEIVYNKELYICAIKELKPLVLVSITEKKDTYNELPINITICQSLVNEQKMDLILQKGTELGAYSFIPYKATNSVVKDNGKGNQKSIRWQRIVKESSEQSKRNIIPKVRSMMDISELLKQEYDLKLLCSVNETTRNIKNVIQDNKKYDTMIIVVGPEGGFTKDEEDLFIKNGYQRVSLGKRVLRTETASLVALSYINYELMR